ncbi:hypothetical protein MNEG_15859, partial [Monoraphidium neglectum]
RRHRRGGAAGAAELDAVRCPGAAGGRGRGRSAGVGVRVAACCGARQRRRRRHDAAAAVAGAAAGQLPGRLAARQPLGLPTHQLTRSRALAPVAAAAGLAARWRPAARHGRRPHIAGAGVGIVRAL